MPPLKIIQETFILSTGMEIVVTYDEGSLSVEEVDTEGDSPNQDI